VVNATVPVHYRIRDVLAYLRNFHQPEAMLQTLTERELARFLQTRSLASLLGPARVQAGTELRRRLQEAADAARLGVEILFFDLEGLHPPEQVALQFHEVVKAMQEAALKAEQAQQERLKVLAEAAGTAEQADRLYTALEALENLRRSGAPAGEAAAQELRCEELLRLAGGQIAVKLAEAQAARVERTNAVRGEAERFRIECEAHARAPAFYRARRYLQALEEGLAAARKYLILARREKLVLRLDLKETELDVPPVKMLEKE
jgi:regulator of protease activity HflC (stomatin/prohibitin superfamily)